MGPTREDRRREARAVSAVMWLSVFLFFVLSGSLLAYQSHSFFAGDREDTLVPDVIGLNYEDAALSVEQAGLILRIENEAYSDDVEADIIMVQGPAGGAHVKIGREVLVDVSKGSRTLVTPNVIGLNREEAIAMLDGIGVGHGFRTPRYSDVAPSGTIINQSPPPGAPIALGEIVTMEASAGPLDRVVQMPQLEGLFYEEALELISEERLTLRRVSRTYVPGVREITVSSQFPLAGSSVRQGSEILLTLSAPTSYENLGKRSARVWVNIPESAGTVRVQITVQDRYETKEAYSEEHTGPTTVEQLITSYGRTTVRVNFDGRNIREESF